MKKSICVSAKLWVSLSALAVAVGPFAMAQEAREPSADTTITFDKVVVTARKREERLQDVPVVVSAFDKKQLEAFGSSGFEDISDFTPSLVIDESGGAGLGMVVLRGISTGELNTTSDQAVSINVDGVQWSNAMALRFGQYDVEQIEVLKGPQALFFGKNSPAGILSLRTSDPTTDPFVQLRIGYEENAEQVSGEAIFSGPVTDTLAGRLVLRVSDQSGPFRNLAPGVAYPSTPDVEEHFARLSLMWQPSDRLSARFKLGLAETKGSNQGVEGRFGCDTSGLPAPISGPIETCQVDEDFVKSDPDPNLATVSDKFRAKPSGETSMVLSSLEINYDVTDSLTVTSLTGYSDLKNFDYSNLLPILPVLFVSGRDQKEQSLSQEFRLASNSDGPLNFMVGMFADDRKIDAGRAMLVPAPAPPFPAGASLLFENDQTVDANSASVFGQLIWDLSDTLELSGGARYTEETKKLSGRGALTPTGFGLVLPGVYTPPVVGSGPFMASPDELTYENLSPELTLAWRPNTNLTLFGSYKEGFKSGGFNTSVTGGATLATVPSDQSFNEELVKGFEIGVKSEPVPGLLLNGAVFTYDYDDIQLTTFDLTGGGIATRVVNAAEAKTQGVELDTRWQPETIQGLSVLGSLAYTDAKYTSDLFFQCNGMQIAGLLPGCDYVAQPGGIAPVTPGTGDAQNLKGESLLRAPEWSGSLGFLYDSALTETLRYKFNGNASYTSSFDSNVRYDPRAVQDPFWILNASFGIYSADGRWSLDLIGRNLTNEIVMSGSGGVLPAGGTVANVSPGELQGPAGRPRSVLLQLTYRPFSRDR
ncbi:TonB-dependent receptor [Hyphomonas johnsonii]|uniref:Putative TonB dependent receptor n=1 Tax=Hyphomonas johnsonii MHS-2 TaxID=1280950 RepID=A0A059FBC3_9PROT|nr:TonB-dependent receptor [Hyphomonas johnsonii]KCZ87914.1 putative TonB dependent receptor [Hyphomonas johnsonii MHS-2]